MYNLNTAISHLLFDTPLPANMKRSGPAVELNDGNKGVLAIRLNSTTQIGIPKWAIAQHEGKVWGMNLAANARTFSVAFLIRKLQEFTWT